MNTEGKKDDISHSRSTFEYGIITRLEECWNAENPYSYLERDDDGQYKNEYVDILWKAWNNYGS